MTYTLHNGPLLPQLLERKKWLEYSISYDSSTLAKEFCEVIKKQQEAKIEELETINDWLTEIILPDEAGAYLCVLNNACTTDAWKDLAKATYHKIIAIANKSNEYQEHRKYL